MPYHEYHTHHGIKYTLHAVRYITCVYCKRKLFPFLCTRNDNEVLQKSSACHVSLPVELLAPRTAVKVSELDLRWL